MSNILLGEVEFLGMRQEIINLIVKYYENDIMPQFVNVTFVCWNDEQSVFDLHNKTECNFSAEDLDLDQFEIVWETDYDSDENDPYPMAYHLYAME